jgi:hypothetical protein
MSIPYLIEYFQSSASVRRFWDKITIGKSDECWEWQASKRNGYGQYGIWNPYARRYETPYAHRISYILSHNMQQIAKGLCVLHACDNRACCNPSHLSLGTKQDNTIDMVKKRRCRLGEDHFFAKLNPSIVRELRRRYDAGGVTIKDLAHAFGIGDTNARDVIRRRTWKHVR